MNTHEMKHNIKKAYGQIAKSKGSSCCGGASTDNGAFAKTLGYSDKELSAVPDGANMALSCGNPTAIAGLKEGETVLDLGSGGGFDCFIAAKKVGKSGRVIGVDMTPEMVEKATRNAVKNGIKNVEFRLGDIEDLPVEDNSIDVIVSNCVINLASDKRKAFSEALRVLKPGGRISISDIALKKELPENVKKSLIAYVGCVAGALHIKDYAEIVKSAGFKDVKITEKEIELGGEDAPSSCACGCGSTDSPDPISKLILDALATGDSIGNYAASIDISAVKK